MSHVTPWMSIRGGSRIFIAVYMFRLDYTLEKFINRFLEIQANKVKYKTSCLQKANELKEKELKIDCAKNGLDYDKI